ncbi:alpha/beta hydrolase [Bacillus toyonensis]|uniref:alpha/beta hydrolase n=1 Tax=Bacillus cereus group TaxID=86661 RepID=UPI0018D0805B|nr:alpha/beta hydrolase [Bacillus toyonensis]MBH0357125.1 hypothetical protein [Bacillus toyonensis biovar Thuringiensis]
MNSKQFYLQSAEDYLCVFEREELDSEEYVLFLHGLFSTKNEKNFVFSRLSSIFNQNFKYGTMQFDFMAHGDSTGDLSNLNLNLLRKNAEDIIRYIYKKTKKIHLIAHGIGNIIALDLIKHNDFSSVILINPILEFPNLKQALNSYSNNNYVDLEELMGCHYKYGDSGSWGVEAVFNNPGLHKEFVDLGAIEFDSLPGIVSKFFLQEISDYFSLQGNIDKATGVNVISGIQNTLPIELQLNKHFIDFSDVLWNDYKAVEEIFELITSIIRDVSNEKNII